MPGTRRHHIGRTRIAAAKLLRECFPHWDVQPEDIRPQTGAWRTNWKLDVYRWELYTHQTLPGSSQPMPVVCGCWQTLTEFVRLGKKFGIVHDDGELWANEK